MNYVIEGKPLSVNHTRKPAKIKGALRMVTTKEAKAWKLAACWSLKSQRGTTPTIKGPCVISITAFLPINLGDVDNYAKHYRCPATDEYESDFRIMVGEKTTVCRFDEDGWENDPELIADAGNTYQKDPTLPSELLRQLSEANRLLRHIYDDEGSGLSVAMFAWLRDYIKELK